MILIKDKLIHTMKYGNNHYIENMRLFIYSDKTIKNRK